MNCFVLAARLFEWVHIGRGVFCCVLLCSLDACLFVVLAGVAMMQIVGAPCVKAGPSANGKLAARLPDVDGMAVNVSEWCHSPVYSSL